MNIQELFEAVIDSGAFYIGTGEEYENFKKNVVEAFNRFSKTYSFDYVGI